LTHRAALPIKGFINTPEIIAHGNTTVNLLLFLW